MSKLTLNLPGLGGSDFQVPNPPGVKPEFNSLGSLLSNGLNLAFTIAGFLMLIWFAWGVLQYIFAGGNKQGLDFAKKRITWAIAGFFIIILAFMISQYVQTIFNPNNQYAGFSNRAPSSIRIQNPQLNPGDY